MSTYPHENYNPNGLDDFRGPTGPAGIAGPQGPRGFRGLPGARGSDGTTPVINDGTISAAVPRLAEEALSATILALATPSGLDGGNATSSFSGTFNFDGGSAA